MKNNGLPLDIIFDDFEDYGWPEEIQVVRRGRDEYIFISGRLLTAYGAPVGGSEDASYYVLENILRQLMVEQHMSLEDVERHFADQLWPLRGNVFDAETTINLYRVLRKEV
jgi:hypothetical protein